ncbi:hypothetical protein Aab01nite_50650 [Paractinoplanes abujensis]|uniref:DUF2716 domain-containing protein n=1 Tax=Paractinoplanes abujensis TaxID=882441 RepID=A0A7W7CSE8_9ACTN|nr:hypothetical protein [Actinoplanes abujensis]MBB4693867.1 hypothetical protein [Actinoplanes abujensis]GID21475.1 hypothetical protein Aab01nite_50650 [Actinoplanes abujensis]
MALVPQSDLSPATWLTTDARPWHEQVTFGPGGLPAYARLRFIPDPAYAGQSETDADTDTDTDEDGPSETDQLRTVLETLARYTTTPGDCYYCLWEGWGTDIWGDHRIAPAFPPAVLNGPRVELPHRSYFLFRGPLTDFAQWGAADMWPGQPRFGMPDPAFMWPADHAWCIARDVDPHWAGIGAPTTAIAELIADPRIDVVPADPAQPQPAYG